MRIAFRFDSAPDIGMGHLMRCLTLATALRQRGGQLLFLCSPYTQKALKSYWPAAHCLTIGASLPERQDALQSAAVLTRYSLPVDWLIADHYRLNAAWERQLRPHTKHIMAIDDLARRHDCDLLLDTNFSLEGKSRYEGKVPKHCKLLLGPGYALLRAGFKKAKTQARLIHQADKPLRVFVCFGGSDPLHITQMTAQALAGQLPESVGVDIVVGFSYAGIEALEKLCQKQPNWRLWVNHSHPEMLMAEADLAIGAGGTMTWERCAMGLPSIVISIADNQLSGCLSLAAKKTICYLGHYDHVDSAMIRNTTLHLLEDAEERSTMAKRSRDLIKMDAAEHIAKMVTHASHQ